MEASVFTGKICRDFGSFFGFLITGIFFGFSALT